jgi:hypothetical protein
MRSRHPYYGSEARSVSWLKLRPHFVRSLSMLLWAEANGWDWNLLSNSDQIGIYPCIARHGSLEVVQFVLSRAEHSSSEESRMVSSAALGGDVDVLHFLHDRFPDVPLTMQTFSNSVASGSLETVQWLFTHIDDYPFGLQLDQQMFVRAIIGGNAKVLQWMDDRDCPWAKNSACEHAAMHGQLEALQWLRLQGCPWNERTCNRAAEEGHLEVLRWARSQGCEWTITTCHTAAQQGNFEEGLCQVECS